MTRRLYGLETEYGITCATDDGSPSPLTAEQSARELFATMTRKGRSTNAFLPNGGRLYLDVGAHPEYATAECDSLEDLLAQDRAGAQLLSAMATEANASISASGLAAKIHLFRNNFDFEGNSFGCHENYLLKRRRDFREVADSLVAFFVSRQVLVGAGAVKAQASGEVAYCFSARSDQMLDAISAATTRARPIINARDEPLADASAYRRMHVIVGDSNMAEPSTALKVGSTELLLNALDAGAPLSDLRLKDPLAAIRDLNWDLSGQLKLPMADGTFRRAVDIQATVLERVRRALPTDSLTELQTYVLDLWERGINAVATDNWRSIDTELDFAIKKKLLDAYMLRSGAALDDLRVSRLLLDYHDITGGLRDKLEQSGLMRRLTSPAAVDAAAVEPPQTTRAKLRGQAIAAAEEHRRDLSADWVHLRLEGDPTVQISLQDPFDTNPELIGKLLALMEQDRPNIPA